nr:hypothetical protein Iba_chr02bCG10990 [Ipomoea batatas]
MNMQRDKLPNRVGEGGENGGCAAVAELGRREISGGVWFTNFEYANRGIKEEGRCYGEAALLQLTLVASSSPPRHCCGSRCLNLHHCYHCFFGRKENDHCSVNNNGDLGILIFNPFPGKSSKLWVFGVSFFSFFNLYPYLFLNINTHCFQKKKKT